MDRTMTQAAQPIWNRRQFGLFSGAALLATSTGCAAGSGTSPAPAVETLSTLGIQLYSVRDSFVADPLATLKTIAASGYAEVEFGGGGYFAREPDELRGFLQETGLTAPSMHCSLDELAEQMDRAILMAKTIGANYVVVPYVPKPMRETAADWKDIAARCVAAAQRLKDEGITLAYHNHDFEFDAVDGDLTGYDILTSEADPDLVKLELDIYWVVAAKQDGDALVDKHAGRIELCHLKDVAADGKMILPGEGNLDFQAFLHRARDAGLQHYIVEDDRLLNADAARLKAASDHLLGMEIT